MACLQVLGRRLAPASTLPPRPQTSTPYSKFHSDPQNKPKRQQLFKSRTQTFFTLSASQTCLQSVSQTQKETMHKADSILMIRPLQAHKPPKAPVRRSIVVARGFSVQEEKQIWRMASELNKIAQTDTDLAESTRRNACVRPAIVPWKGARKAHRRLNASRASSASLPF